jgi:hypothetical protein
VDTEPDAEPDQIDGDDEQVPETDDFEITDADREADRNLAIQVAAAALTGAAALAGTVPGAAATMFQPIVTAIMTAAVQRLGKRRTEHAAETLLDAADASGIPLGEFLDLAVADDRRHELFARSMRIAQDTALRDKRRALGRALAAGIMGDDARIDEELLFMRAVEDIDEMHIRLLARMAGSSAPGVRPGWSISSLTQADPGLANGARALLGTLELHGLIGQAVIRRQLQGEGSAQDYYNITPQGREFLDRLAKDQAEAGEASAEPERQE